VLAKPIITAKRFNFQGLGPTTQRVDAANRERYQALLFSLFALLEEMAPAVLALDSHFDTSGRTDPIFRASTGYSLREGQDALQKHMYLKFSVPPGKREPVNSTSESRKIR